MILKLSLLETEFKIEPINPDAHSKILIQQRPEYGSGSTTLQVL